MAKKKAAKKSVRKKAVAAKKKARPSGTGPIVAMTPVSLGISDPSAGCSSFQAISASKCYHQMSLVTKVF